MEHSAYQDRLEAYKEEHLPVVLTPAEAMDILGVGKNTMYRLLKSGELNGFRVGRSWRVPESSIEKLMYGK
jgi:excisionase family DNA binding protein